MQNENGEVVDKNRNILQEIAQKTRERIRSDKELYPLEQVRNQAQAMGNDQQFPFEKAIKQEGVHFICEVKQASPSKGLIAMEFDYLEIAKQYEGAGASAISCLTEPYYFLGEDRYLQEIAQTVSIPVLKKDFFVDPYMIYQAKIFGASAILLICALLNDDELSEYFQIAEELGLSAIFEAHTTEEIARAMRCNARIIGVNNRNLKTFAVDLNHSKQLRKLVSDDVIFIAESGIKTSEDIKQLVDSDIYVMLIGEAFMKESNKKEILDKFRNFERN